MNKFEFKEPKLCKDKDNTKWFVRISIRYITEKNYISFKEYGRIYNGYSLNGIKDLKLREKEFQDLIVMIKRDLSKGIILKQPETLKALDDKAVNEAKKLSYDECFKHYMQVKKYNNPAPKKEKSAEAIESFHRKQFRPFLVKKGLDKDISKVTKPVLQEFMNSYYLNGNPALRWSNNTFNWKRALLSTFFETVMDKDLIIENPVKRIKTVPRETTSRFAVFSKEERDILFDHLDKGDVPLVAATSRVLYYAYIRETEMSRLLVSDFNIEKRSIRIAPENAKGQKDGLVRFVRMTTQLQEALVNYLSKFEHQPDWYMFGKKLRPAPQRTGTDWTDNFRDALAELRITHPGKFNRRGLSPYSLKHSGVTDFINDNAHKSSIADLYRFVQSQCRHEDIGQTQRYMKKLEINLEMVDSFDFI